LWDWSSDVCSSDRRSPSRASWSGGCDGSRRRPRLRALPGAVGVTEVVVAVLLALGVAFVVLSCAGVVAMRDPFDRLHFTSPAATVAPILFTGAVLVEAPLSSAGIQAG